MFRKYPRIIEGYFFNLSFSPGNEDAVAPFLHTVRGIRPALERGGGGAQEGPAILGAGLCGGGQVGAIIFFYDLIYFF